MEDPRTTGYEATRSFQLPFRARSWRGSLGNWAGAGIGSSIDFQDHRPYVPGDDPRYVDWRAYARSEHYVMKLYREEVSPAVDLLLDRSSSMSFDDAKRGRCLETLFFALESALAHGSVVRMWLVDGSGAEPFRVEAARKGNARLLRDGDARARADTALVDPVPLRPGSLRVLVSDCLFPGSPDGVMRKLVSGRGRAVVFAPATSAEASPDWLGHVELLDCETDARRIERFDEARLEAYRQSYQRHFQLWEASARRHGCAFARVSAEIDLLETLRDHALPVEAVHPAL